MEVKIVCGDQMKIADIRVVAETIEEKCECVAVAAVEEMFPEYDCVVYEQKESANASPELRNAIIGIRNDEGGIIYCDVLVAADFKEVVIV
ncbi:MAG: hypothetical protein Q4D33_00490 [Prevotellaceae bacterium]|nr:hypothetical protein [Prevotellaceae bacterium]